MAPLCKSSSFCSFTIILLMLFTLSAVVVLASTPCKEDHYNSLLLVKSGITFHNSSYSWVTGTDCCMWPGVTCNGKSGEVTEINLGAYSFPATVSRIHPALFNLTSLRSLKMSLCGLSGQLPTSIGNLTSLTELTLDSNSLSGQLPSSLGNLASLQRLSLANNNFSGLLQTVQFGKLKQLTSLDLSSNNFSGNISSIAELSNLASLALSGNNFTGPIPLFKSENINSIDLSRNKLTGTIPSSFSKLHKLQWLYVSNNKLSGLFPSFIFGLPSLSWLVVKENQFSSMLLGDFPGSSSLLSCIDLSENHFEGTIPRWLFQLPYVDLLDLSSNNFSGIVDLSSLILETKSLSFLYLSNNNITIISHSNFSGDLKQSKIEGLYLANCNMAILPNILEHLPMLIALDLSINKITGRIPHWFFKLHALNISHNSFIGFEKHAFLSSSLYSILDLSFNYLHGPIPLVSNGTIINFSNNNFTQSIPSNVSLTKSRFLSMSKNKLVGEIPSSLCNGTFLEVLDLSHNQLSGMVPGCLVNISTLRILDLHDNELTGLFPYNFHQNCSLQTLNLNNNILQGQLPSAIVNCKELQVLNVGNNNFVGLFPQWVAELPNLQVLVLRKNAFSGHLPSQLDDASFPMLKVMDLSFNRFNGVLPHNFFEDLWMMRTSNAFSTSFSLGYDFVFGVDMHYQDSVMITTKGIDIEFENIVTTFTYMDLSSNKFGGIIPIEIGKLVALKGLNLSFNYLHGHIPWSLKNLRELESLDLSWNNLDGNIPMELASLTYLAILNLSYNSLVGEIPQGRQFSTFDKFSFIGNKALCGHPLQECSSTMPMPKFNELQHRIGETQWVLLSSEVGFIVGLVLWYGPLLLWVKARILYYKLVYKVYQYICK